MYFKSSFYYKLGQASSKKKKILKLLTPLEIPYIMISLMYIVLRFYLFQQINPIFLIVVYFSSIWFIIGPYLVHNFITYFISFQANTNICFSLRQYFKNNERIHFKIYKICLIIEGTTISLFGVIPIILFPDILTENVTYGIKDLFFWLIIFFVIWFLFYCANATSFISLIAFKVIRDIVKDKIFIYNPTNIEHHRSLEEIHHLCNKAVAYTCSGLVFIPLAIYFILQQPGLMFDSKTNTWTILLSPFRNSIYLVWVTCLLLIYCTFLFLFITYPNFKLKRYVQEKSKKYLLSEQAKYLDKFTKEPSILLQQKRNLSDQLYQYNVYLRLQEIEILCKTSFSYDSNTIVAYITILVTFLSAIPGFIQVLR